MLDDEYTRAAVTAERAVLAGAGGRLQRAGRGAWPTWCPTSTTTVRVVDRVSLRAVVRHGRRALLRASATGDMDVAEKLGAALAAELLDLGADRAATWNRWIRSSETEMNRAPSTATAGPDRLRGHRPRRPRLLTVRARDALARRPAVVTDPDVPEAVLALVADGAEVRPAVGRPRDVARELVAEAGGRRARSPGWSRATR